MPGLCAIGSSNGAAKPALVDAMLERMRHYPWLVADRMTPATPGAGLGVVSLDTRRAQTKATSADGRLHLVLDGEFHRVAEERARLERAGEHFSTGTAAEVLLCGWRRERTAFLTRLDGLFSAAIVDDDRKELILITDRFGLRPTYVAHVPGMLVAASEIKSLLLAPRIDRTWSDHGVAQFFSFGHLFNDDTLFRGVRALPPATCLVYHLGMDTIEESRYATPTPVSRSENTADLERAFEEGLVESTARRAAPGEKLGLSLSGGLDARTLLGVAPKGLDLTTVSLGVSGSIDHRGASQLASLAGVPHHQHVLDGAFLQSFEPHLQQMVRLTDGHYLDQGIVMPTLPVYRELGIEYLIRGHAGELAHMRKAYSYSLDDAVLDASEPQLENWLAAHLTGYMTGGVPQHLFVADLQALARQSLRTALAETEAARAPVDRIWPLFLRQRLHRETALSMHKFGCFATVRMPYLGNEVVEALLAMPASMKLGDSLQYSVLQRRRPDFLKVVNSNTGAPMGAGPAATAIAHFRMRVSAKLGLPGYQPYERLGLWLKRDLRPLVERLVLGDAFLSRGICRPDAVRKLVAEHFDGAANRTFLIMGLMVFEMGQEMLETQ